MLVQHLDRFVRYSYRDLEFGRVNPGVVMVFMSLSSYTHLSQSGHGFTLVSSVLYALAAAGLSNLLGQANSSADLEKLVGDVKLW